MAEVPGAIFKWEISYDETAETNPWSCQGVRWYQGQITVSYNFEQDTLDNLMIAINAAMGLI